MRRSGIVITLGAASLGLVAVQACSGDSSTTTDGGSDAANDTLQQDVSKPDASDAATDAASDVSVTCASWMNLPDAAPSLAVPDGGGNLLLHAAGTGTQNYTCESSMNDAGVTSYAWTFVGPVATLDDCTQTLIGHHFASEAGAGAPEWQTLDDSFIIGKAIVKFDAGSSAVPWLLVQETSNGGNGTIASTLYVQRLFTTGGVAPSTTCDGTNVNTTTDVAYTADYYFYGP